MSGLILEIWRASALVTGGASGLGLATVRLLHQRGAMLTIMDLPGSHGADIAEKLGPRARFVPGDVTNEQEVLEAVAVARGFGPLRALVHTAGRGGDRLRIVDRGGSPSDLASFAEVVRVNLIGTYNVLRLVASEMSRNQEFDCNVGRGACVLTASIAAFDGQVGQTSYAASKAGVHAMTLVAARDLASYRIRVNTIAPGVFDTPMLKRMRPGLRSTLETTVPFPKRLGYPEEFARLAVNILENDYVNGETIRIDGALRMPP